MKAIWVLERALWHMAGGRGPPQSAGFCYVSDIRAINVLKEIGLLLRRRNPYARSSHLSRTIHAEFIENACARLEVGGQTLYQAGDVEENVAPAIIGSQESKPLGLEVRYHAAWLLAGGRFLGGFASSASSGRAGRLIADALLDEREIGFRPIAGGGSFSRDFKLGIALPGFFE
jgi:hypothetical protein